MLEAIGGDQQDLKRNNRMIIEGLDDISDVIAAGLDNLGVPVCGTSKSDAAARTQPLIDREKAPGRQADSRCQSPELLASDEDSLLSLPSPLLEIKFGKTQ